MTELSNDLNLPTRKMEISKEEVNIVPFSSCINPSFWHKLATQKLDVYKLDETPSKIWGYYSNLNCTSRTIVDVDSTSFNSSYNNVKFSLPYHGLLIHKNTIEQFKDCDKFALLKSTGRTIEELLKDGKALENPSLLNNFFLLCYADLKNYNFYYWFAFLARSDIKYEIRNAEPITKMFNEEQVLYEGYDKLSTNNKTFFIIENAKTIKILTLKEALSCDPTFTDRQEYLFAFSDPSGAAGHPGWPIKNYIMFLSYNCKCLQGKYVKFLGLKLVSRGPNILCSETFIWDVYIPIVESFDSMFSLENKGWVGYEPTEQKKMGPRLAKMKKSMSPESLANSAVDLNLKLMKWRLLPNINLDRIQNTKCLLLGAGTLGCAVARNLLGWGVRNITFVDNGSVSYSNPVRQNLYTFEDSASNNPKALAAAEALKKIFPGVVSHGYNFTIPMPGHPVGETVQEQTKEAVEKITKLIEEHDIIFLLMDSRESRWLPTLLGCALKKIVVNAALGFDTYLVMRHGSRNEETISENVPRDPELKCIPGNQLGCYFCNDITAPGDSLKERTLDQQCTVTRPGVANIAAALAVELAVSILQHEMSGAAPAYYTTSKNSDLSRENENCLGILPHSIRGFLSLFTHFMPAAERYAQCIACSDIVVKEYQSKGFQFLMQVFNDSKCLEELTGLSQMYSDDINLEELHLSEDEGSV